MGIDHNDYFGNIIKVGDLVVWPNRQSSSMWMNHGYVMALGHDNPDWDDTARQLSILQVKRVQTTALGNVPTGKFRNVTLTDLSRVIALGRVKHFVPRKEKVVAHEQTIKPVVDNIRPNLIDKIMGWFRGIDAKIWGRDYD